MYQKKKSLMMVCVAWGVLSGPINAHGYAGKKSFVEWIGKDKLELIGAYGAVFLISGLLMYLGTKSSEWTLYRSFEVATTEANARCHWVGALPPDFEGLFDRMRNPQKYEKYHLGNELRHVLFIGPPGNGKTMCARMLAHELNAAYLELSASDVVTMWQGSGTQTIKDLFDDARRKKKKGKNIGTVLFIDEIDAIGKKRFNGSFNQTYDDALATLLTELTSSKNTNLLIIGATNRLEDLDPALIRSGRFGVHMMFDNPNAANRRELIMHYMTTMLYLGEASAGTCVSTSPSPSTSKSCVPLWNLGDTEADIAMNLRHLVDATEGFCAADIKELCDRVLLTAAYQQKTQVSVDDMLIATQLLHEQKDRITHKISRLALSQASVA